MINTSCIYFPKNLDIKKGSNNEIVMLLYQLIQNGTTGIGCSILRILEAEMLGCVFQGRRSYRGYG